MVTTQTIYHEMKKRLPNWSKDIIRPLVWSVTKAHFAPPVAQMYLCNAEMESYLGINNFYSLLSPTQDTEVMIKIDLYDSAGVFIGSVERQGRHFSGVGIRVADLLKKFSSNSPMGLITCELIPRHPRRAIYKPLGICASHFFVFYRASNGSMGHIHPSSVLDPKNTPSAPFVSNQSISSVGLQKISLLQLNPCKVPVQVEHRVLSLNSQVTARDGATILCKKLSLMGPFETRVVEFESEKDFPAANHPYLTVGVDPLPSSNSKPLLFRYYKGLHFSVSHS